MKPRTEWLSPRGTLKPSTPKLLANVCAGTRAEIADHGLACNKA